MFTSRSFGAHTWLSAAIIACASSASAQTNCLFAEDFSSGSLPAGWSLSPAQVERLDANGVGTGTFTAPFVVGNATAADQAGYFPVPDQPAGNAFAMANDDASPCDCAMDHVSLATPAIDLTGASAPALAFRYYHDGRPFNGRAWLEASADGLVWSVVRELPEALATWQQALVELSAFSGGQVFLRFTYDDGGAWASGFAVDDICVFSRTAHDIAVKQAWLGDRSVGAFNTSERSLGYSYLPVEQQPGLVASLLIRNLGTDTAFGVSVDGLLTLDGENGLNLGTIVCSALPPLQDTLVTWAPGWSYDQPGIAALALTASMADVDEQGSDNTADLSYRLTSPTHNGHSMGLDNDLPEALLGGEDGFSIGCRYELAGNTGAIEGVSCRLGAGTLVGTSIAALIIDANVNVLNVSTEHVITQADLDLCYAGGSIYLDLDSTEAITGDDLIALIRFTGDTGALYMAAGGEVPTGAAWRVESDGLITTYPAVAPIVRIHLSEPAVGIPEPMNELGGLKVHPNPANSYAVLTIQEPLAGMAMVELISSQGTLSRFFPVGQGRSPIHLDLSGITPGVYLVRLLADGQVRTGRLVVLADGNAR